MDTIKIMEEAPGEYAQLRQKSEARLTRIRKRVNYILLFCAALLLLFWCYTYMGYRVRARALLGVAKNVELAVRLTAIEYYGYGSTPYDAGRESGLKEEAERKITKYAETDGQIRVLGWDDEANAPTGFVYLEEDWLVIYTRGKDGRPDWQVCRMQNILTAG